MTALRVPARPEEDASLRPVPWQRMGWVTWRQHRATLAWVIVFLGALAVPCGRPAVRCTAPTPPRSPPASRRASLACPGATIAFDGTNGFLGNGFMLQAVPVLIGAFAGAPVLARELETGTFRYAWTQAFGRWRWTLAKLVPLAVALAAAAGVFSLLFNWYYQPYFVAANQNLSLTEYDPVLPRPVRPARDRVRRLDAGRLRDRRPGRHAHPQGRPRDRRHPGRLRRARLRGRRVPAPALSSAAGYQQPEPARLRVDHQPVVDQRRQVRLFRLALRPPPQPVLPNGPQGPVGPCGKSKPVAIAECLTPHGYTQWTSYQPASRFWPFQWIEGGWLLVLSALLIAADRVAGPPPGDLRSHRPLSPRGTCSPWRTSRCARRSRPTCRRSRRWRSPPARTRSGAAPTPRT